MSARVVVVDDSPTMVALVSLAVRRAGHEAATAADGESALALIRRERPDLVIIDAIMPGTNGYDVCKALRDDPSGPRPHVIMLTAGGQEADRIRADEAGIDEFMTKPFSPSELGARVRDILGEP